MTTGVTIGYVNFAIFMLVLTGILMLRIDVNIYKEDNQNREYKTSRFLGWFNIVSGSVAFVGNWLFQYFIV